MASVGAKYLTVPRGKKNYLEKKRKKKKNTRNKHSVSHI